MMEDHFGSLLRLPGSRIISTGLKCSDFGDDLILVVNSGGGMIDEGDSRPTLLEDSNYLGGDIISSEEKIIDHSDYPCFYQSARYGNFSYVFSGLGPGDYLVDLHFAEMVYTNGPKGIRVFNVFLQEYKIISELDIYANVGANKPLQIVNLGVSLAENDELRIKFEGIIGPPIVCGICIRKAAKNSKSLSVLDHQVCNSCGSKVPLSPTQNRTDGFLPKLTAQYEKKIKELTGQFKQKNDECHEVWMLLSEANEQKEQLRMKLDNKFFQIETIEKTVQKQASELKTLCEKYSSEKNLWDSTVRDLEMKFKVMKQEHSKLSQEAHECAKTIPDLSKMLLGVESLVAQCEDLKAKYSEELARSKRLHNQIQEIKGNIRVFCRCRPLSKEESTSGYASLVDFEGAKDGDISIITGASTKKTYRFDRVYTLNDDQADVYADTSPFVTSVMDGYNVCIFAYGQTGTGKTFTMEGTEQNRGVNYRTLEELFKIVNERRETVSYSISVSVLEVYNEQIRDLLATSRSSKKLEVKQAAGVHHVPGIIEAKVENIKEVWDVLQAGSNARAVGSNNVNEHSSRSHCMLSIMVGAKNLMSGDCTRSKLWLVDLAGSERLAKTDVQGERLKEAQNINRSLSALGDVISALANKSSHIPYRNSKLTHLLQDSLGGDSKAVMFVQISPSENDLGETISSLSFASRVRGIELGQAKKQIDSGELQKMKQMIEKQRQESRVKEESLRKLEENYQNLENKMKGKDQLFKSLQEKNKELEGQLESRLVSQNLSEKQHSQLSERLKAKEETCGVLQSKVKELESKINEQNNSEQKIKVLEHKLKEQLESESTTLNRVKELEWRLNEKQSQVSLLEQKVMQLENQLKERAALLQSSGVKASPREDGEGPSEGDLRILRCSNYENRPSMTENSAVVIPKGADHAIKELRKKRERRSGGVGESENVVERRFSTSEVNKSRRVESSKTFERLARTTRAAALPIRKPVAHAGKTNEERNATGIMEKEKIKLWSR